MLQRQFLMNALLGGVAVIYGGTRVLPIANTNGPVVTSAISFVSGKSLGGDTSTIDSTARGVTAMSPVALALHAFESVVRPLSDSRALEDAFGSYFAYKSAHPDKVRKPYLYFVDYGLPSTTPRGYVFDMTSLAIVDGPFMVAHGRGSSVTRYGVPTRFSNAPGSAATSLGLYVAEDTYDFHGKSGGQSYASLGLRLDGVSAGYNDNAHARGVVAHGAPYITPAGAGRSEGCPAMDQARARRLLPELANGGLVFLFAPDTDWMSRDPWVVASNE
jgi:L,D-transpeptidase catalytic domain